MFILSKIMLFCFWFCLGYFFYSHILQYPLFINSRLKKKIDSLTFFQLVLIFFLCYLIFNFIITSLFSYFIMSEYLEGLNISHNFLPDPDSSGNSANVSNSNTSTNSSPTSTTSNTNSSPSNSSSSVGTNRNYQGRASDFVDGAIMSIALAGGIAAAKSAPTLASKAAALAGSILSGGAAIIVKNASGNISEGIGKKSSYTNLTDFFSELFQLTGNSVVDLLFLIQVFQKLQLLFLFLFSYYSIIFFINEHKLEELLLKLLPIHIVNYIMKAFRLTKKGANIFRIFTFIVLIFVTIYPYYYFDFFLSNFDAIVDFYISTRK
uniref:Uncharacterized protein n=1 Tax=Lyophyllum shimeji TaxID=47721 RepID=A0A2Z4HH07_LYOSH|nr:hypothetical protein [Lyophyllum shimeji]AWW14127.1 hypothetical protein [Lyophyllum shimeji]